MSELMKAISKNTGVLEYQVRAVLDELAKQIAGLTGENTVRISNLGTFKRVVRSARAGRKPGDRRENRHSCEGRFDLQAGHGPKGGLNHATR
jgi:nucleoid DNA-binding protein